MSNQGASIDTVSPLTRGMLRDVSRHWPLVLLVALVALAASAIVLARREASYTATTKLVITPVSQDDDTFLGVDVVREAGDPRRTDDRVAATVDSPEIAADAARRLGQGWTATSVGN